MESPLPRGLRAHDGRSRLSTACALAWTHLFVSNEGLATPCCHAQDEETKARATRFDAAGAVSELANSRLHRETRREMIAGIRPAPCHGCFKAEDEGRTSPRLHANRQYAAELAGFLADTKEDGAIEFEARSFDLRLGNLCNLKCRMCGPRYSTALHREWTEAPFRELAYEAGRARELVWTPTPESWMALAAASARLEKVYLAGGEPALIESQEVLLESLIASGRSRAVELIYNTNATRIIPDLERLLGEFRAIQLSLSLDGFGEVNSYIRHGADWSRVVQNLIQLDELAVRYPNLSLRINTTVQALNLTRIADLVEGLAAMGFARLSPVPEFGMVHHPEYLAIGVLPRSLRESARVPESEGFTPQERERIAEFESMKRQSDASPFARERFVGFTRYLDRSRGQDLARVLPEVAAAMFDRPVGTQ